MLIQSILICISLITCEAKYLLKCLPIKKKKRGSSRYGSAETNLTSMGIQVRSLASFSGLRIQCCHNLWCTSQIQLRSCVAMAVAKASSCTSNSTPSLGTSICHGYSSKKTEKKKKKKERERKKKKKE